MAAKPLDSARCEGDEADLRNRFHKFIPFVVQKLLKSCNTKDCFDHVDSTPIPSKEAVITITLQGRRVLFPGYFTQTRIDPINLGYRLGEETKGLYDRLGEQIALSFQHDCLRYDKPCLKCMERSRETALKFIQALPDLRKVLGTDVRAAMEGDPAAKSHDEVIFSYPGLFAISIYRMAHKLSELDVPLLPRMMTEYAHNLTGIDIHPGAKIGKGFFIDHGTGVVVGETTVIGDHVRIYQGVTLGALSIPRDRIDNFRSSKRHPTIEDDVIIYANTTILGGETVIGARAVIGGNIWITESVPSDTKVILKRPELVYIGNGNV